MAGSLNKAMLIGNLGRDPEIRSMQNGGKVANLAVATSESWKDRDGNKQEKTEWHRVVVFQNGEHGVISAFIEPYMKKGDKVFIEGKIQTRKWTDQNGADKYTTEIVCQGFDSKVVIVSSPGDRSSAGDNQGGYGGGNQGGGNTAQPEPKNLDDEIPF